MQLPTVLPSERDTGIWTTCVWLTGLYIARALKPGVPATKAEMLAIAAAGGHPDGASGNFTKLAAAMKMRYGLVAAGVYEDAAAARAAVLAAAQAGPVAVGLAGDQLNLTPHYQANSLGHAIAVVYPGGGSTGTQFDPLAASGYAGDPFPSTELAKFTSAAIVFKAPPSAGMLFTSPIVTQEWDTVVGAKFTRPSGSTGTFNQALRVKSITEGLVNGVDSRLLDYGDAHEALVIGRSGLTNPGPRIVGSPAGQTVTVEKIVEVPTGISQAQLDQANASIAALEGRLATAKKKTADHAADIAKV